MAKETHKVTGIEGPKGRMGAQGRMEMYYTVKAQTARGILYQVDVPSEDMDITRLKPLLEEKAKRLDSVLDA